MQLIQPKFLTSNAAIKPDMVNSYQISSEKQLQRMSLDQNGSEGGTHSNFYSNCLRMLRRVWN